MMTFKQRQEYYSKRDAMLKAQGEYQDEESIFFCGGRGGTFGRRPVSIPTRPQPNPKPDSPDGLEKRD
jgi:hypothetical protein